MDSSFVGRIRDHAKSAVEWELTVAAHSGRSATLQRLYFVANRVDRFDVEVNLMSMENEVSDEISRFLREDLPRRGSVDSVILCGSYANGNATTRSDIDLCYIGQFENFSRESILYHGTEYQLMIAPWSWYQHVVSEHE